MKNYLRVRDVAEALDVTEKTVRIWIANDQLRASRIGRTLFIAEEELERALSGESE